MQVHVPLPQIIEAFTDDAVISRWWTVVTGSERRGDEVKLFMGGGELIVFTIEHTSGTGEVTWAVTACGVLPDWVDTLPSFSHVRSRDHVLQDTVEAGHTSIIAAFESR